MTRIALNALCTALCAVFLLSGCDDTGDRDLSRLRAPERPEYDCRKHSPDKICEVPWKDKVVLYCYKNKVPKVVRYRWEC